MGAGGGGGRGGREEASFFIFLNVTFLWSAGHILLWSWAARILRGIEIYSCQNAKRFLNEPLPLEKELLIPKGCSCAEPSGRLLRVQEMLLGKVSSQSPRAPATSLMHNRYPAALPPTPLPTPVIFRFTKKEKDLSHQVGGQELIQTWAVLPLNWQARKLRGGLGGRDGEVVECFEGQLTAGRGQIMPFFSTTFKVRLEGPGLSLAISSGPVSFFLECSREIAMGWAGERRRKKKCWPAISKAISKIFRREHWMNFQAIPMLSVAAACDCYLALCS